MSITTTTPPPPAPPQNKKFALGCFGCGCLVLIAIAALFVALIGGSCYYTYNLLYKLSSPVAADVPSVTNSDDLYKSTEQKVADFDHDVKNHQAATIHLSADEINALLAHSPGLNSINAHVFVSITGDEARMQGSVPTDKMPFGLFKGRYANFDTSFGLEFDNSAKGVTILLHSAKVGDEVAPDNVLTSIQPQLNLQLNVALRKDNDTSKLLDEAKSIRVKDGELIIETQ